MKLGAYLLAAALSALLALPVYAQSTSTAPSNRSTTAAPNTSTHSSGSATGTRGTMSSQSGLVDINSASAQELDAFVREEIDRWTRVIHDAHITITE